MYKTIIGKKIGMTNYFCDDGSVIPVTVCELGPCTIIQKKTVVTDGYSAIKLGYMNAKESSFTKPILQDFKNKNLPQKKILSEINHFDTKLDIGDEIRCEIFDEGDIVTVTGISKGKGYTGVVKKYGFKGGKKTHGSNFHRSPGAIGNCAYPGEIWKGQKMPGRHGNKKITIKNLKIMKIIKEKNIVLISGSIPGKTNSIIRVKAKAT